MKKRILIGLLSVAALLVNSTVSYAWLFHHCCGCKYSMYICCRPYNAFTPVCAGNITCNGCCPMMGGCCPSPCMPSCFSGCPSPCGPSPCCDSGCCDSGCCDSGCLPPGGACAAGPAPVAIPGGGPASSMPSGPGSPSFTPPSPTPLPTSQNWPAAMPYGYSAVQTAGYHPNYYGYPQAAYGYPTNGYGYPMNGYAPAYYPGYNYAAGMAGYPTAPAYQAPAYWYGGQN